MRTVNTAEKDELLRFFLYHMSMDQRMLLMATYPLHYGMLFPSVSKETISFRVAGRLEWMEKHSKNIVPNKQPVL